MVECTWRLSDLGSQSIHSVATDCTVETKHTVADCEIVLRRALQALNQTLGPGFGKPVAQVSVKFGSDYKNGCYLVVEENKKDPLPITATIYLFLIGWAERYGLTVLYADCVEPAYPRFV